MLLRELSKGVKFKNIWVSIFVSILLSFGLVITCRILNPDYVGKILAVFLLGMCCVLFSSAILYNTKYGKYIFTISIIGTMLIAGFTINPISSGVNVILDSPILQSAQEINEIEDGIWLVDAMAFPCPNYLEMAGCAVINATSIYPNMDLWKNLDKNGEYEDVYNRYAHVYMEIRRQEDISEKFIFSYSTASHRSNLANDNISFIIFDIFLLCRSTSSIASVYSCVFLSFSSVNSH